MFLRRFNCLAEVLEVRKQKVTNFLMTCLFLNEMCTDGLAGFISHVRSDFFEEQFAPGSYLFRHVRKCAIFNTALQRMVYAVLAACCGQRATIVMGINRLEVCSWSNHGVCRVP